MTPSKYQCRLLTLTYFHTVFDKMGWFGGAMALSNFSVPGRPTTLDNSMARAYCACSRCGWG